MKGPFHKINRPIYRAYSKININLIIKVYPMKGPINMVKRTKSYTYQGAFRKIKGTKY